MEESKSAKNENSSEEHVEFEKELDIEAFNVILHLYDKTFKDLANR